MVDGDSEQTVVQFISSGTAVEGDIKMLINPFKNLKTGNQ